MCGQSGQDGRAVQNEGADAARRRRLIFRAWHRGIREMDLLLGQYADRHIAVMNEEELAKFEHIMSYEDSDLLSWFTGAAQKPQSIDERLFGAILAGGAEKRV